MEILKMSLFLFVVCAVAGTTLALTDKMTAERIADNEAKVKEEARAAVLGGLKTGSCKMRTREIDGQKIEIFDYFASEKPGEDEKPVARVFEGLGKGFGGKIKFMLGADPAGKILGVKVISHAETPGLGTKVLADNWLSQLKGMGVEEAVLSKDHPSGKVDAVTGVTVTSRAVTRGVQTFLKKLEDEFEK